jgi:mono/diheme cytochrome c family protein
MYTFIDTVRHASLRMTTALLCIAGATHCLGEEPPAFSPPGSFTAGGQFSHRDGATLYRAICQGCHMPDARGAQGAGMYPALAANVRLASADYPAMTVLRGRHGMPPFGDYLSDAQIAAVVNYVRSHFDNHFADVLTAVDVAKLRASTQPQGGAQ